MKSCGGRSAFAANANWGAQMCVGKAHCMKTSKKGGLCFDTSVKVIDKNCETRRQKQQTENLKTRTD